MYEVPRRTFSIPQLICVSLGNSHYRVNVVTTIDGSSADAWGDTLPLPSFIHAGQILQIENLQGVQTGAETAEYTSIVQEYTRPPNEIETPLTRQDQPVFTRAPLDQILNQERVISTALTDVGRIFDQYREHVRRSSLGEFRQEELKGYCLSQCEKILREEVSAEELTHGTIEFDPETSWGYDVLKNQVQLACSATVLNEDGAPVVWEDFCFKFEGLPSDGTGRQPALSEVAIGNGNP